MEVVGPPTPNLPQNVKERNHQRETLKFKWRRKKIKKIAPCRAPRGFADPWATATHTSTGNHIWEKMVKSGIKIEIKREFHQPRFPNKKMKTRCLGNIQEVTRFKFSDRLSTLKMDVWDVAASEMM